MSKLRYDVPTCCVPDCGAPRAVLNRRQKSSFCAAHLAQHRETHTKAVNRVPKRATDVEPMTVVLARAQAIVASKRGIAATHHERAAEPAAARLFFEPLKCRKWREEAEALIARRLLAHSVEE